MSTRAVLISVTVGLSLPITVTWSADKGLIQQIVPTGAVVAFNLPTCPEGWGDFPLASGKTILGLDGNGSRKLLSHGGAETQTLIAENLPPHVHRVYKHAGIIKGNTGVRGAGADDPNRGSEVADSETGPGPGASLPFDIMPPYVVLKYCVKE